MSRIVSIARLTLLATFVLSDGCGGGGSQSPAAPTLPTTPNTSTSYNVSLFGAAPAAVGQVSVDTAGKVTLQLNGVTASTTLSLQSCPAPAQHYTCLDVGTVTSDAIGTANKTLQFPSSGSWAGDFQLVVNGTAQYETNVPSGTTTGTYSATLQPQATANGKGTILFGATPAPGPLTTFLDQVATHCMMAKAMAVSKLTVTVMPVLPCYSTESLATSLLWTRRASVTRAILPDSP